MKPKITISLSREEAELLTLILYDDSTSETTFKELLNDLVELLQVKPWRLYRSDYE